MKEPVVVRRWYIVDERTGKRRLTRYCMTRRLGGRTLARRRA